MIAGTMLEPVGGVSHVRVVYPLQAMATDAAVQTQLVALNKLPDLGRDMPKVLVLHRPVLNGNQAVEMTRWLAERGWIIVTEFDDHPDFFRALQDPAQLTFRSVHAVQTSTEVLASILRQRNPEVRVFPNVVRELSDVGNFADPDRVTLFYGALNREADWAPLMGAINEVAAEMGERLRVEVVHDQAFFDALTTPHKRFTPTCEHDSYLRLLRRSEICFMPLSDTPFNRAKSDLKFIEAAACRVATVASDVVYGETVQDGRTGLIFRNEDELRTLLTRLVTMPDVARDIGDAAREYVARERMLAYQTGTRIAWYRSLWERRAELNEAVRARIAGREMMAEAAVG